MIIVTGAAGFIGSFLVKKLNNEGFNNLVLVDDFSDETKNKNLEGKQFFEKVHRKDLMSWMDGNGNTIDFVFHIGARTDTTEFDTVIFDELNLNYSKNLWEKCVKFQIPFIYASSAATYGMGEFGFEDSHELVEKLQPLNPYGISKNEFDKWVIDQKEQPFFWAGLKFFNVYGPNEYHKGSMRSVVVQAHKQIKDTGKMKLFKSYHPDYKDGEQLRDFVYVKDVVQAMVRLMFEDHQGPSGLYNLGTGQARSFKDLVLATFAALDKSEAIEYIDMPDHLKDQYQYYTQANMNKLAQAFSDFKFHSLEEGVKDYVQNYLEKPNQFERSR